MLRRCFPVHGAGCFLSLLSLLIMPGVADRRRICAFLFVSIMTVILLHIFCIYLHYYYLHSNTIHSYYVHSNILYSYIHPSNTFTKISFPLFLPYILSHNSIYIFFPINILIYPLYPFPQFPYIFSPISIKSILYPSDP